MRYVAAYLLSSLGGKESPTAADIDKILSSVGIESDSERVSKVISELKGKNIEEVIAAGKLSFPLNYGFTTLQVLLNNGLSDQVCRLL